MAATNVRVKEEVISALKLTADRLGLSLQALVDEILEREAKFGSFYLNRPVALPPGLLDVANIEFEAARVQGAPLPVVYKDANGGFTLIIGTVRRVTTMSLSIEIWDAPRTPTIPRARILAWEPPLSGNIRGEILKLALAYQQVGVVLHPMICLPTRDAYGV